MNQGSNFIFLVNEELVAPPHLRLVRALLTNVKCYQVISHSLRSYVNMDCETHLFSKNQNLIKCLLLRPKMVSIAESYKEV